MVLVTVLTINSQEKARLKDQRKARKKARFFFPEL